MYSVSSSSTGGGAPVAEMRGISTIQPLAGRTEGVRNDSSCFDSVERENPAETLL